MTDDVPGALSITRAAAAAIHLNDGRSLQVSCRRAAITKTYEHNGL
jgi:hypothetical protein